MARTGRALGALVAAVVMLGGAAAPALASGPAPAPAAVAPAVVDPPVDPGDGQGCAEQESPDAEGYAPPGRCELLLVRAEAICLAAAPVLDYAVEPVGTDASTVTLTWVNPDGEDLVQTGLPLSARVYWPGTVVENGEVVDWPGWTLDDSGAWVRHDAYDFTRPQVQLVLEVNPSVSTVVQYPPESAVCAGPRVERVAGVQTTSGVLAAPELAAVPGAAEVAGVQAVSGVLAVTGTTSGPLLAGGSALVLLGVSLVALASRRRHHHPAG